MVPIKYLYQKSLKIKSQRRFHFGYFARYLNVRSLRNHDLFFILYTRVRYTSETLDLAAKSDLPITVVRQNLRNSVNDEPTKAFCVSDRFVTCGASC